ncbi:beta-1,3-galactosyltransferase 1-like isoform X1 [Eriocheir sinensis]|uniref:beta-1,3-galactosyltransferase 1-like isoform X1 n=1 Tax=Eriocheir sinensis TaxID=95602 RepID=UPI0021C79DEB|nr:beta-1,3-galactosyltransferase 1-like isoform X1 [Eriocheir sinensis]
MLTRLVNVHLPSATRVVDAWHRLGSHVVGANTKDTFKKSSGSGSRWRGLIKMPRKPRLPALLAYLFLLTLGLLLYVSARGTQQGPEGGAEAPSWDAAVAEEARGREGDAAGGKGVKRRGRGKDGAVNPHDFHMMINKANLCTNDQKVWLLVVVSSAVPNFLRRRAIRDTWGSASALAPSNAKLVFLLANPHNDALQTQVVEESRTYGDILQEDFTDSYMNLTLKSVMGLKWTATHCQQAQYLLKTDDDIFVNVPTLLTYLQEAGKTRWITGCIKQKKAFRPVNAVPGMPLPPAHPPFVAGAGYVVSGDLIRELYEASLSTRPIPVEDVYVTAHLAKKVNAHPPTHDARFTCGERVTDDCDLAQAFTGHHIGPERMYRVWEKLNPNGVTSPCFDF